MTEPGRTLTPPNLCACDDADTQCKNAPAEGDTVCSYCRAYHEVPFGPVSPAPAPPRYGPGEDYDGTFHVTDDEDGGRTVAVCPTWEDAVKVAEALSAPARNDR